MERRLYADTWRLRLYHRLLSSLLYRLGSDRDRALLYLRWLEVIGAGATRIDPRGY